MILTPYLASEQRRHRTDVAITLHDRGGFARIQADGVHRAIDQIANAASGRFAPAEGTAEANRFARDDAGHALPMWTE